MAYSKAITASPSSIAISPAPSSPPASTWYARLPRRIGKTTNCFAPCRGSAIECERTTRKSKASTSTCVTPGHRRHMTWLGVLTPTSALRGKKVNFLSASSTSFNRDLHLIMVTSTFVERAFRHSGVMIPITVVGNGCDHVKNVKPSLTQISPLSGQRRITHICQVFPVKASTC